MTGYRRSGEATTAHSNDATRRLAQTGARTHGFDAEGRRTSEAPSGQASGIVCALSYERLVVCRRAGCRNLVHLRRLRQPRRRGDHRHRGRPRAHGRDRPGKPAALRRVLL